MSVYNELDFEYDLMPWPVGKTGETAAWIGSLGIGVSTTTDMPDEAVKLVTYLSADPTAQETLVNANIQVPNLIDVEPANRQEFVDIVQDYGRPMPAAMTYGAAWYDELWTNIQPVVDGQKPAAEYLAEVQPRMQALLDESNAQAEQAAAASGANG
jgi:multiple sugar transport system substrate-binding protein